MRTGRIFVMMLFVLGTIFLAACRSQKGEDVADADRVMTSPKAPNPDECQRDLLKWLGRGINLGGTQAHATDLGCDMTFDVAATTLDAAKASMSSSLSDQGYVLVMTTPARRGERLTFRHSDGRVMSLLLRGSEVVKVSMPGAIGQAYVHWYAPKSTQE